MTDHEKKYEELCKKHGVAWNSKSPRFVNETLESITKKYLEDEHLNNVPLYLWDIMASGFFMYNRSTGLSLAEGVCMQKHAAIKLIKENLK